MCALDLLPANMPEVFERLPSIRETRTELLLQVQRLWPLTVLNSEEKISLFLSLSLPSLCLCLINTGRKEEENKGSSVLVAFKEFLEIHIMK